PLQNPVRPNHPVTIRHLRNDSRNCCPMIEGSLLSHLLELRTRLIRIISVMMIGFIPCAFYARELYTILAQPLLEKLPQGGQMIATDVATPFFVPMKVALMLAFVITLPHTLYQA